jgi:hypothetical protein
MADPNPNPNPAPTPGPMPHPATKPKASIPQPSPFDWRVILLALYLLLLLLLSINWLAGLMLSDTSGKDDSGKEIVTCKLNTNTNTNTAAPANSNAANGSANSANSNAANSAANTNAASNTNTTNTAAAANTNSSNANANANRAANNASANKNAAAEGGTAANTANKNGGNSGSSANDNGANKGSELPRFVTVSERGMFGSNFSISSISGNCLTGDGYIFFVVLFAGMMGALIRALVGLYWHMGRKDFSFNWIWYYIIQPFFGASLGLVFYMVIRGGFSGGSIGKGNVFAFAAVGALTGLFSDNAMAKLKQVAEALLVEAPAKTNKPKSDDNNPAKDKQSPVS